MAGYENSSHAYNYVLCVVVVVKMLEINAQAMMR